MSRLKAGLLASALAVLSLPFLVACIWDVDTIAMERAQFPSALELITGKFIRHSDAYYEWRVQDRLAKLKDREGDLALRDDLAVAYDKLKQHQLAIDTMTKSLELQPKRYETLANLGTFYIHAGNLEVGLDYIKQAIAINPDAHFGREVYQQLVVEYVLDRKKSRTEGALLPLRNSWSASEPGGFVRFLRKVRESSEQEEEVTAAVKGILGMMRFGDYQSPVLLEVLGDLMVARHRESDATQLAARAYWRAAAVTDAPAQQAYLDFGFKALSTQLINGKQNNVIDKNQAQLEAEVAEAERWFQGVVDDERRWIEAGVDVDAAFAQKYYADPVVGEGRWFISYWWIAGTFTMAAITALLVGVAVLNRRVKTVS
ncbi:MAG: hypothetical protein Q8M16_07375 [Pirellulaceae bacterium]|nr:hypothetical protein [Pirellulaceae bacterium]